LTVAGTVGKYAMKSYYTAITNLQNTLHLFINMGVYLMNNLTQNSMPTCI